MGEWNIMEYDAREIVQREVSLLGWDHTKAAFKLSGLELRLALEGEIRILTERRILCVQAHRLLNGTGNEVHKRYWYKF